MLINMLANQNNTIKKNSWITNDLKVEKNQLVNLNKQGQKSKNKGTDQKNITNKKNGFMIIKCLSNSANIAKTVYNKVRGWKQHC